MWNAALRLRQHEHQKIKEIDGAINEIREQAGFLVNQNEGLEVLTLFGLGLRTRLSTIEGQEGCPGGMSDMALSGMSAELTKSLIEEFSRVGARFRSIAVFTEQSYKKNSTCTTKVAVIDTMNVIVYALKKHLLKEAPRKKSILQLRRLFQRPGWILHQLDQVIESSGLLDHDELILNEVFRFAQDCEDGNAWFQPIARWMLRRISRPWLDALEKCLALRSSESMQGPLEKRIRKVAEKHEDTGEAYGIHSSLPQFIGSRDEKIILQTCQSLDLLKGYDKENILTRPQEGKGVNLLELDWKFGWEDTERIQCKAKAYENTVMEALRDPNRIHTTLDITTPEIKEANSFDPYGTSVEHITKIISYSEEVFEQLPKDVYQQETIDTLNQILAGPPSQDINPEDCKDFFPPLSLASSISFSPIISAQARLVNFSCLRTLMTAHNLPHHFRLQQAFQLLDCGTFTTRLTNALFSPTLSSTERRKGRTRAGNLGLRLGSRSTWPPASSELRLALMGILTESYAVEFPVQSRSSAISTIETSTHLPSSHQDLPIVPPISFAIRHLSESEISACMDPSSLQALDFLRLQYKPPPPISTVITDASLDKYDGIFKLLLRLSRVVYVATQASTSGLRRGRKERRHAAAANSLDSRLRLEMMRFVSTVAAHLHASIQTIWSKFERTIGGLAMALEQPDILEKLGDGDGLHRLRALHEGMLEDMLFALLLRKRQEPVMAVLEEILGMVLEFARLDESAASNEGAEREKIMELYKRFGKKVAVFVAVCKGLGEKGEGYSFAGARDGIAGAGGGLFGREIGVRSVRDGGGAGIEALVVRLTMNGWYERRTS